MNWVARSIFAMHTHNDQKGKNCLQRWQVFFIYMRFVFYSGSAWPLEIDTSVSSEYRNFCETKLAAADQEASESLLPSRFVSFDYTRSVSRNALQLRSRDPQSHTHPLFVLSKCWKKKQLRSCLFIH
jgi:hypothetical protein